MLLAVQIMPKRINTSIADEVYDELQRDCDEAGVTMSDQMRALLELRVEDPHLRRTATERAQGIRKEALRRQYRRDK